MKFFLRQFKQIILITALVIYAATATSQVKKRPLSPVKPVAKQPVSQQLKDFYQLTREANVTFTYPKGLKEIPAINNDDFSYDYAMALPGHVFELWLQVKSQQQNYSDYQRFKNDPSKQIANPDSAYNEIGHAQASAFAGDQNFEAKKIPAEVLARYNADAGKTYLLNLEDRADTKHYKYALLITLQKNQIGTIIAVCFTNDKGAEFFKNINRASKCLKFNLDKPALNAPVISQKH